MAIQAIESDGIEHWFANGGRYTIRSYTQSNAFVEDDIGFFKSLPLYHETEDNIFVHAGLNPDHLRPKTSDRDTLLWIREDWLRCEYVGKPVVFGHTPGRSVTWDARGGKIGIDTGAVRWGTLSCLELPTMRVYMVSPQTFVQQKNKGKRAMLSRQVLALNQITIGNGDSDYRKTMLPSALHLREKCGNIDSEQVIKVNSLKNGGAKLWV